MKRVIPYWERKDEWTQQGIFISSDATAKMSVNFYDTRLDVNFEAAFDTLSAAPLSAKLLDAF